MDRVMDRTTGSENLRARTGPRGAGLPDLDSHRPDMAGDDAPGSSVSTSPEIRQRASRDAKRLESKGSWHRATAPDTQWRDQLMPRTCDDGPRTRILAGWLASTWWP